MMRSLLRVSQKKKALIFFLIQTFPQHVKFFHRWLLNLERKCQQIQPLRPWQRSHQFSQVKSVAWLHKAALTALTAFTATVVHPVTSPQATNWDIAIPLNPIATITVWKKEWVVFYEYVNMYPWTHPLRMSLIGFAISAGIYIVSANHYFYYEIISLLLLVKLSFLPAMSWADETSCNPMLALLHSLRFSEGSHITFSKGTGYFILSRRWCLQAFHYWMDVAESR